MSERSERIRQHGRSDGGVLRSRQRSSVPRGRGPVTAFLPRRADGAPMSWVEIDDAAPGRVVVELQPTVLEVFQARVSETTRLHLRMLVIEALGPNGQGHQQVKLANHGGSGLTLTVPEQWWARLWPLLEQARTTQFQFQGY